MQLIVGVFPAAVLDVIAALEWLRDQGASKVVLYGDSSGATQVVETLIYLENERHTRRQQQQQEPVLLEEQQEAEERPGWTEGVVNVDRAVTLSGWFDLTSSSPTFWTRKWCSGSCDGPHPSYCLQQACWRAVMRSATICLS